MDIRAMRYFLEIAETENVSKAAERSHMSQPPLTRQMRQLEEELNVELFERENGRLHLTEAGYYFREHAREIVELTEGNHPPKIAKVMDRESLLAARACVAQITIADAVMD